MNETAAQEFSYFVLNTPEKWHQGSGSSVVVNETGHLTLAPSRNISSSEEGGSATGLAVDRRRDVYFFGARTCGLYRYSPSSEILEGVSCFGGCGRDYGRFRFAAPDGDGFSGGLAFSGSTLLVADAYNHRVQGFYLPYYQIRFVVGREENCTPVPGVAPAEFHLPTDIVADSQGQFYVLDYGNRRIQQFHHAGRFRRFIGADILQQPESFALDASDCLYVIDSDSARLEVFDSTGQHLRTVIDFTQLATPIQPSGLAVGQNGIIYVGEQGDGDNLHIHQFDASGRYFGYFGRYSKRCRKLIAGPRGGVFASCGPAGQIVGFTGAQTFESEGIYYSRRFDSTIEECHWHRIALELVPAEKARLDVFFHASDKQMTVEEIEADDAWQPLVHSPQDTKVCSDALFFAGVGRYLHLKFTFFGDGAHSYEVAQCNVYFERLSYLRYLPAVYQEDPRGRDFMERFLSLFESLNLEVEEEIEHMARFFDPDVVRNEFLEWLGAWLALLQDKNWSEQKRRTFLRRAYHLYTLRGTAAGLSELVGLFTGAEVTIIEHYKLFTPMVLGVTSTAGVTTVVGKAPVTPLVLENSSQIGEFALKESPDTPEVPFTHYAFDFSLLADTTQLTQAGEVQALYRLIEEEKPAHTRCRIQTSEGDMQLGTHAFLQVDTKLSRGFQTMRLGITSRLGKETFPGTYFCRRGMLGGRSRIAVDTLLN